MDDRGILPVVADGCQGRRGFREPGLERVVLGLQPLALLPLGKLDLAPQGFHLPGDFLGLFLPVLDGGIALEDHVGLARGPEVGLQPVVVDLPDGVEHVIVAAGAADRKAEEGGSDDVGALGENLVAAGRDFLVAGVAPDGTEPVQARRRQQGPVGRQVCAAAGQLVAGDLLADEPVERNVPVQGVDHVIAVAPQARKVPVVLEAFGFRVAHDVQPPLGSALALARACQEPVHQPLPGARPRIG